VNERDPLADHHAQVDAVLPTGDPAAIKQLYRDLGDQLAASAAAGAEVPVLSMPETLPVVAGLLAGATGLVLDAGCGPRPVAAVALARGGATAIVVDIGLGTVRLATALDHALVGVVADMEALPFRDGAFAAGLCDDTIEHLPDDLGGVRELARVVASGGRMVIATPNRRSLFVVARKLGDRARRRRRSPRDYFAATSHLREYTWPEVERLVAPYFDVRRRVTVPWPSAPGLSALTRRPPLRRLSRMIVVLVSPRTGPATRRPAG
jgi:SAM-dependent methyltransferase